ncbi:MAG: hypothetical protein A3G25_00010 [Betaproteobacteria bacterium RIFCSPLOWO2_12_FULL_63_13]|nr:MAG: hypothetical protein A3G25_00010 [Betaproteobacteria bacterium RIFCSPLOWO2_12_FULL_63_13]
MTRRLTISAAFALLLLGAPGMSAHDEFRIIGTIAKRQESQLDVKTKEGKTISIALNKETFISRDKKKVAIAELRIGRSVVVDALGDSIDELVALEVRLVPSLAAAPAK